MPKCQIWHLLKVVWHYKIGLDSLVFFDIFALFTFSLAVNFRASDYRVKRAYQCDVL